jgi:hypothetical protein
MPLLRAIIVDEDWARRVYVRMLLLAMGIDSLAVRDARSALRYASPFAIDLIISGEPCESVSGGELLIVQLIAAGVFGNPPPQIVISSDAKPGVDPDGPTVVAYLPRRFGPGLFFRVAGAVFDAVSQDQPSGGTC